MDKATKDAGEIIVALWQLATWILGVALATLFGACAAWIAGLFFGETVLGVVGQMGVRGVTMWDLGAALGFVGWFFRTKRVTVKQG